ncbi:hypothetical protein AVEN_34462-1 [Araneus ventricosus]|uniref:Uncharacterized protein n=1 Tax=Araneus ventricosus TaxID=182803 RepID=A0A4Y2IIN3_ARAVE|nr:hypothetical protein AVEN_34462-1 [Araneus ventricosus]
MRRTKRSPPLTVFRTGARFVPQNSLEMPQNLFAVHRNGEEHCIKEHYLGSIPIEHSIGDALIERLLIQLEEMKNMLGQSYDNRASMKRDNPDVQTQSCTSTLGHFMFYELPINLVIVTTLNLVLSEGPQPCLDSEEFFKDKYQNRIYTTVSRSWCVSVIYQLRSKLVLQLWCEVRHNNFSANLFCKWVGRLCFVTLQEVCYKVAASSLSWQANIKQITLAASVRAIWVDSLKDTCTKYDGLKSNADISLNKRTDELAKNLVLSLAKMVKSFKFVASPVIWPSALFKVYAINKILQSENIDVSNAV